MNKTLTYVKRHPQIILCCLLAFVLSFSLIAGCAMFATSSTSTPTSTPALTSAPRPVLPLERVQPTENANSQTPTTTHVLASPIALIAATTKGFTQVTTIETPLARIMTVTLAPLPVLLQTPIPLAPALLTPLALPITDSQQTIQHTAQTAATAVTPATTPMADLAVTILPTITANIDNLPPLLTPTPAPTLTITATKNGADSVYVPILMYHYLSQPPANADIYRLDLSVPPDLFAAHLDRLAADGFSTISLYDLLAYFNNGTALPSKPVILTFDDGYRDNYTNALPLLRARGMKATFFVVIDFINQERPEYVSWDMVREMYTAGMSIEAHGLDHSSLRKRSNAELEFQALRSYETIENRIGVRPRFISYPAGEYDQATLTMFQSAGYWAGVTTKQGATHTKDKLFELRRVRIRGTTTADELVRLLQVDW